MGVYEPRTQDKHLTIQGWACEGVHGISDGVSAAAKPGSGKASGGQGRTPDPAQRRALVGSGRAAARSALLERSR
ncbi:unnamed protein product [Boreogadus saida]